VSVREQAIEAAARAIYVATGDAATDCDEWMTCQRDAVAILAAAVPALLNDLADQIEVKGNAAMIAAATAFLAAGLYRAAGLVRAAAGDWGDVIAAPEPAKCESGCGCRYGTADPDRSDCACDGPCAMAAPEVWGCVPALGGCGGDCPACVRAAAAAAEGWTE